MNQKSQSPTSLLRGTINRAIISAGLTPTKESLYEQIHQTFTLEESLRMAYIPVLLNKTAFHFAEEVCRQCAAMKMPYKHETRAIRQATSSYISSTLGQFLHPTYSRRKGTTSLSRCRKQRTNPVVCYQFRAKKTISAVRLRI